MSEKFDKMGQKMDQFVAQVDEKLNGLSQRLTQVEEISKLLQPNNVINENEEPNFPSLKKLIYK